MATPKQDPICCKSLTQKQTHQDNQKDDLQPI